MPISDVNVDESSDSLGHSVSPLKPEVKRSRATPKTGLQGHRMAPAVSPAPRPRPRLGGARSASAGPARANDGGTRAGRRLPEHELVGVQGDSAEDHLKALVEQQKKDHSYFKLLTAVIQGNFDDNGANDRKHDSELKSVAEANLGLRREMYGLRDQQAQELPQRVDAAVRAAYVELLEPRVLAIENALEILRTAQTHGASRDDMAAKYLEQLHGERPQEGNVVIAGFKHVTDEIQAIRQQVYNLEAFAAAAGPVGARAPSPAPGLPMDALNKIEALVLHFKDFTGAYNTMCARVNEHDTKIGQQGKWNEQAEHEIAGLKTLISLNLVSSGPSPGAPDPAADPLCGPCGPAPAPGACTGECCGGAAGGGRGKPKVMLDDDDDATMPGPCHCPHVDKLIKEVAALQTAMVKAKSGDPWHGMRAAGDDGGAPLDPGAPAFRPGGAGGHAAPSPGADRPPRALPLVLRRPLGGITCMDRHALFDDKMTLNAEFRYDGVKEGPAWKVKLENYFMGKAAILQEIFVWAESETDTISEEKFILAVSAKLDEDQAMAVNAALWGFLAGCVQGAGTTVFKRSEHLNGIDAWRRMVRQIDKGLPTQYETKRREVKAVVNKPIRTLEQVEEGIAAFENAHRAYQLVGGPVAPDSEMKYDLLAILPKEIREPLIWHSTESHICFSEFRDVVQAQTAKVLLSRGGQGLHAVEPERGDQPAAEPQDVDLDAAMNLVLQMKDGGNGYEEVIAYINKMRGGGGGGRPPPKKGERPVPTGDRKCPNCGKVHPPGTRTCPTAQVPVAERPCWFCGIKGHNSQNCEKRKKAQASGGAGAGAASLKALMIEDQQRVGQVCFAVTEECDADGYRNVKNGSRPRPRPISVNDFIKPAMFFNDDDDSASKRPSILINVQANREDGPGHPLHKEPRNVEDAEKKPEKKFIKVPKETSMENMTLVEFEKLLEDDRAAAELLMATEHQEIIGACPKQVPPAPPAASRVADPPRAISPAPPAASRVNSPRATELVPPTACACQHVDPTAEITGKLADHQEHRDYRYEDDVTADGPDTQWEILKHTSVPGYKPVDWHRMSESQRAQAVFLGMKAHQRDQADRMRREQHQAACERLGMEYPDMVSQAHTVSCLKSLSTAKHCETLEELEEKAWIKFSETSSKTSGAASSDDAALKQLLNSDKVNCVIADDDDDSYIQEVVRAVVEERKLRVAIDSGSVDNVVHPDDLPENIHIEPNAPGTKHFKGANDSHIERFGQIATILKQEGKPAIRSDWVGADVSRALHSVSKVCGQPVAPKQDVLFNANKCFVVAPGVVDQIMKYISAVAEYDRDGGLYTAEMTVSSFTRPGASA